MFDWAFGSISPLFYRVGSGSLLKPGHYSTSPWYTAVTCLVSASPEEYKKFDFEVHLVARSHLLGVCIA